MLGATINRVDQIVDAEYAKALEPFKITARQLVVLQAIRDIKGDPSQTAIVTATGMDRSTTADVIRRMLNAGLIARKRTKDDARAYAVTLTAEGTVVVKSASKLIDKIDAKLTAKYGIANTVRDLAAFANARAMEPVVPNPAKAERVSA
jgi:DNA-binding MarR family transcriptional regulator